MLFPGLLFLDKINFVLKNENMFQFHDLNSREMFRSLRLGTRLIAGNEEQGSVHDGGPVQHGGHQDVVAGAVHEADVPHQVVLEPVHQEAVLLGRAGRGVAHGSLALGVVGLVDLGVGVAELDRDVPLQLVLEPDRVDTRQSLDHRGLAVSHMTNCTDVDGGLTGYNLRKIHLIKYFLCMINTRK